MQTTVTAPTRFAARNASSGYKNSGLPAILCSTTGTRDFISSRAPSHISTADIVMTCHPIHPIPAKLPAPVYQDMLAPEKATEATLWLLFDIKQRFFRIGLFCIKQCCVAHI